MKPIAPGFKTTMSGAGLARRAFTVPEVLRMQELGILHPDERIELVEGEIVPLFPRTTAHDEMKETLMRLLIQALPEHLWLGASRPVILSARTALDPDLSLCHASKKGVQISGRDLLLVVEIGDASLQYDLGLKAALYARYGVREYWVIDPGELHAVVHTSPREEGSWEVFVHALKSDALTFAEVPSFRLKLMDV